MDSVSQNRTTEPGVGGTNSVIYQDLIAVLTAAIQDSWEKNTAMKAKLDQMETQSKYRDTQMETMLRRLSELSLAVHRLQEEVVANRSD